MSFKADVIKILKKEKGKIMEIRPVSLVNNTRVQKQKSFGAKFKTDSGTTNAFEVMMGLLREASPLKLEDDKFILKVKEGSFRKMMDAIVDPKGEHPYALVKYGAEWDSCGFRVAMTDTCAASEVPLKWHSFKFNAENYEKAQDSLLGAIRNAFEVFAKERGYDLTGLKQERIRKALIG